jgi:hypothetical protein
VEQQHPTARYSLGRIDMSCYQICSGLRPGRPFEKIKVYISDIRNSAREGCGNCRLLLDAINSFDREQVKASEEKAKIWCEISYEPEDVNGSGSHFRIYFEEEINASSDSIELFTPPGSFPWRSIVN